MSDALDPTARVALRDALLVELVPHVVHRLGNQLTVVLGTADLLAMIDEDPERRQQLEAVAGSAREATDLIRALGLYARSEPGPERAEDLTHVHASVEPLLSPAVKAGGYRDHGVEARGVALVRGDQAALSQLVLAVVTAQVRVAEGDDRRDGDLRVRAVELGERVALVVTVLDRGDRPYPALDLDPRVRALAASVGGSLRQRVHAGGRARTLLLGLPALGLEG